jgi:DNA invertase Pin-like site-specific DNA recombinase
MKSQQLRAVLYARYSTGKQKLESLEDQFHVCERVAAREGFVIVDRFGDREISGGTAERPAYQAMLTAARSGKFDVIVVEDISRLTRNRAEFGPRSAELEDLKVNMVTAVGDDTRRDGWGLTVQIKLAMAEHGRREASYRTRRGQEGLARAQKPTGGRAFGFISAKDGTTKQVEIHPEHSATVRRVFEMYADGMSPRSIANQLNTEGVPSPGASWNRRDRGEHGKRRDGKWVASCIHGDPNRGTGMLNNPRYLGRIVWGRTQWQRSAANSSIRLQRPPEQDAVEYTDERLRIVSDELWERVKARQRQVFKASEGIRNAIKSRKGRPARHLFSGLLKCAECGANFVRVNNRDYRCATYTNGGRAACGSDFKLNAANAERVLLDYVTLDLLSPEAIELAVAEYRDEAKKLRRASPKAKPPTEVAQSVARIDHEMEQLKQMIRSGTMTAATLRPAIDAAETERARLLSQAEKTVDVDIEKVARLLPDAVGAYRTKVERLSDAQSMLSDAEYVETRGLVFDLLGGSIPVRPRADGSASLKLEIGIAPIARAYGSMSYKLVAGARLASGPSRAYGETYARKTRQAIQEWPEPSRPDSQRVRTSWR